MYANNIVDMMFGKGIQLYGLMGIAGCINALSTLVCAVGLCSVYNRCGFRTNGQRSAG
jgi:hypothetical protein